MAPQPISAPTLSAPRPIAPRHDGRAAARYRHSFDDQSSVWCLEAGLRGFTQGAQAGGRLVLRRALPENDAAATHQAFARRFIAKACSSASRRVRPRDRESKRASSPVRPLTEAKGGENGASAKCLESLVKTLYDRWRSSFLTGCGFDALGFGAGNTEIVRGRFSFLRGSWDWALRDA